MSTTKTVERNDSGMGLQKIIAPKDPRDTIVSITRRKRRPGGYSPIEVTMGKRRGHLRYGDNLVELCEAKHLIDEYLDGEIRHRQKK